MSALPPAGFEIPVDDETFWAATTSGTLLVGRCDACADFFWYPRPFCPSCGGSAHLVPATGAGVIYSFTVVRKARGAFREAVPYVVAYVELSEGIRILSNIVDCDLASVRIGLPVEIAFDDPADVDPENRPRLYRFRPVAQGG